MKTITAFGIGVLATLTFGPQISQAPTHAPATASTGGAIAGYQADQLDGLIFDAYEQGQNDGVRDLCNEIGGIVGTTDVEGAVYTTCEIQ